MTTPQAQPTFDMWAAIPAAKGAQSGWSLVASGITLEQAQVYKATFLFPVSFQQHVPREGFDY